MSMRWNASLTRPSTKLFRKPTHRVVRFWSKRVCQSRRSLYEGMFGRLRIPAGERRHLCLNTDAVIEVGQLEFVDVVLPDGNIERRLIKIGQLGMPGRQEVLSGVEAGERVVLHGDASGTGGSSR